MNSYEAYKLYIALKSHFTTDSYDFFKFHGKTKTTLDSFEKRNDKKIFEQITEKFTDKEIIGIYISNMISKLSSGMWSGDFLDNDSETIYAKWLKGVQSFRYVMKKETQNIIKSMDEEETTLPELLTAKDGQHPLLFKLYMGNEISLETLIVYLDIFKVHDRWDSSILDPVVWVEVSALCRNYKPFLKYNKSTMKKIIKKELDITKKL